MKKIERLIKEDIEYEKHHKTKTVAEILKPLIERAKTAVINSLVPAARKDTMTRRWLEVHADSYNDSTYRIQLLVFEGSEPRGYILVNYYTKTVLSFTSLDKLITSERLPEIS